MGTRIRKNIVTDGLVFYIDALNTKSYIGSGDKLTDLVNGNQEFGLSWFGNQVFVSDTYGDNIFITNGDRRNQSIYSISNDVSYRFSSDWIYVGGVSFDLNEVVNGAPVAYGGGFASTATFVPAFYRYEYQGDNKWSQVSTKTLSNRRHAKVNIDNYNTTNSRADIWISSSNNNSSTQFLTLHQWNGSDYVEYDFTSKITSFVPKSSKFITSVVSVGLGRLFIFCMSFTNTSSDRNACIVELLHTGGAYTDINNWSTTIIAGSDVSEYGDIDGELGTNSLAILSNYPPEIYKGKITNGQPHLYFSNIWASSWGKSPTTYYLRELFWNGTQWEVNTLFNSTDNIRTGAINDLSNKFYFNNISIDKLQVYDITNNTTSDVVDSKFNFVDQEKRRKTYELVNGVSFNGKYLEFDATNDYIDINDVITIIRSDTTGTVEAWCKVNSTTSSDFIKPIFNYGSTLTQRTINFGIQNNNTLRAFAQGTSGNIWTLGIANAFVVDEWTHIVLVQDGVEPVLYINGEKPTQTFDTSPNKTFWLSGFIGHEETVKIGCQNTNSAAFTRFWNGSISLVKYYNRPLSQDEVLQNYNATKHRFI
jgi:hypothetical protein